MTRTASKAKSPSKTPAKVSARSAAKPAAHKRSPAKPASRRPGARAVAAKAPAKPAAKTTAKPAAKKTAAVAPKKAAKVVAKTAAKVVAKTAASMKKPAPAVVAKPVFKPVRKKDLAYGPGDFVVYPTHGVGRILSIETQTISGHMLELFVIDFEQDRMKLRVPIIKAEASGLRKLSSKDRMKAAMTTLKSTPKVKRTMWSRRAQEYEAKINSGDPVSIAEVVRDLFRNADQQEQSYSERQIYQAALDRLAREVAAVEQIDEQAAAKRLEDMLKAA